MQISNVPPQTTIRTLVSIVTFLTLSFASAINAETTECIPITSLPAVINTQGVHCFTGNLGTNQTAGPAINIMVNNVTIDMNGYKLGGLAAGDGTAASGIYALNRKNITLRNGSIRGFWQGILLHDNSVDFSLSSGHLVEDIVFDGNTQVGINIFGLGITVRNNRFVDTGGSTFVFEEVTFGAAAGISLRGTGHRILNNDINDVWAHSDGSATGIVLRDSSDVIVQNNRISDIDAPDEGAGFELGIFRDNAVAQGKALFDGNLIVGEGDDYGILSDGTADCTNNRVVGWVDSITTCNTEGGLGGNFAPNWIAP